MTEDTTRAHPVTLHALFAAAMNEGASRLCLCDTTGHVTPYGVEELVAFARSEVAAAGAKVELDWHAHNDRGLSVATALWAASAGVERVHGTGLGVGERVGNTSLELLVENLGLIGARAPVSNAALVEYCELAARTLHWTIPADHPIAGTRFRDELGASRAYRVVAASEAPATYDDLDPFDAEPLVPLSMTVSGARVKIAVPARRTLLEALRYDLDLVGTKQGCDKGDCGACTVVLDGRAVLSCLTLALEADGCDVTTVESLAGAPHADPLLDCFDRAGGGQCGFCTPGMLMSATALLDKNPRPTRDQIKVAISGETLCRCTGYGRIVDAVELAAKIKRGEPVDEGPEAAMPGDECAPPPLASNTRPKRAPDRRRPAAAEEGLEHRRHLLGRALALAPLIAGDGAARRAALVVEREEDRDRLRHEARALHLVAPVVGVQQDDVRALERVDEERVLRVALERFARRAPVRVELDERRQPLRLGARRVELEQRQEIALRRRELDRRARVDGRARGGRGRRRGARR